MSPELIFTIAVGALAGVLIRVLQSFKKKRIRESIAAQEALAASQAKAAARAHAATTSPTRKRKRQRRR